MKIWVTYGKDGRAYYFKGFVGCMVAKSIGFIKGTFVDEVIEDGVYRAFRDYRRLRREVKR